MCPINGLCVRVGHQPQAETPFQFIVRSCHVAKRGIGMCRLVEAPHVVSGQISTGEQPLLLIDAQPEQIVYRHGSRAASPCGKAPRRRAVGAFDVQLPCSPRLDVPQRGGLRGRVRGTTQLIRRLAAEFAETRSVPPEVWRVDPAGDHRVAVRADRRLRRDRYPDSGRPGGPPDSTNPKPLPRPTVLRGDHSAASDRVRPETP